MTADTWLLPSGDRPVKRARRAVTGSLLAAAGFEAVAFVSKETPAVYNHAPWLNDPYDTAFSFALFCIPLIVAPCAMRMLAGRGMPQVPASRLSDLLRAAGICLAVVAATAAVCWAAVAVGANGAAWSPVSRVQVGVLALCSVATAVCATWAGATIRSANEPRAPGAGARIPAAGSLPQFPAPDWLGDLLEVAQQAAASLGSAGKPAVRLLGWAGRDVLPAIRRHPLGTAAAAGAVFAVVVTTSQSVNEGYRVGTSLLFFCVVTAGVFAFLAAAGAYLRVVRTVGAARRARRLVRATVLGCAAVPVALAFRAALWPLLGANARHAGLAALWLLLAAAAALTFGVTLLAGRVAHPQRLRGGTG